MFKGKKVVAVIGAAGKGKRMGSALPKQFMALEGGTILEMAIAPFEKSNYVDNILVVTGQDFVALCRESCRRFSKVSRIVTGGKERQESIYQGLLHLSEEEEAGYVLIHDGVRPYATEALLERVLTAAEKSGAAVPAVPVKDTIRRRLLSEDGGETSETLDRKFLYQVQTPQGFAAGLLRRCYEKAREDGFLGTDDASLVERMGYPVQLVPGDYSNIKITTKEDLPKGEPAMDMRIGTGFDVHRLTEGRKLILGGVEIPWEKGLEGHSDADVMIHALMDAMLGAAALGDIGLHFPDRDPQYEGISSLTLLEHVGKLINEAGYRFGNADITIIAQNPKLLPHIPKMRENLVRTLKTDAERISVKATTTERLGFAGREEGIAAEAVCLLKRQ